MSLSETSKQDLAVDAETRRKGIIWGASVLVFALSTLIWIVGWYWSREPAQFDVIESAAQRANTVNPKTLPSGYIFASTLAKIAETLLYKSGGYLTNDVTPPGIFLDNIPSWEYGALVTLRDATSTLRNHFSRSQSQSKEDPDLAKAEPLFYFDNNSWALPSTESEYQKGIDALEGYMGRLGPDNSANFFARADNLNQYLQVVEKRLGDISHRLSASTFYHPKIDPSDTRAVTDKTPWLLVDDIFFEGRGICWALLHIMKAIEVDFHSVFQGKRGQETLQRIIHELEDSQQPVLSPVVLNGNGFGLLANYSLTLANHIARANAAMLDLRVLMERG